MAAISATAASNGSRVLSLRVWTPVTLRTYWRAAASISSGVARGSRPRSVVMLRHMAPTLRDLPVSLGRELGQHRVGVLSGPRHRPEHRAEPAVDDRRRQHLHLAPPGAD